MSAEGCCAHCMAFAPNPYGANALGVCFKAPFQQNKRVEYYRTVSPWTVTGEKPWCPYREEDDERE